MRAGARGVRIAAHAKINLALRILAREETGYHQLETIFQRIELADTVTVRVGVGERALECAGADVGPREANLAWRAALAYADAAAWPDGFAVTVEKSIPVGAGLGGGSADAGAVLRALNALAPSPLPSDALLAVATPLGADVPFLTSDAPVALAWGRGERMLALPPLPSRAVTLVVPPFAIATAEAYGWLAAGRAAQGGAVRAAMLDVERLGSWEAIAGGAANDFEPVVAAHHPDIGDVLAALRRAGAEIALLSGSGSAVFAIGEAVTRGAPLALPQGWRVLRTRTLAHVGAPSVIE